MMNFLILAALIMLAGCNQQAILQKPVRLNHEAVLFQGEITEVTLTTSHHDGSLADRINVVLEVPSETVLIHCLGKAGWTATDLLTFISLSLEVKDILRNHSYLAAPISSLYLFGRNQDLGFEIEDGPSPRQRHHIRLWHSPFDKKNEQIWFGAATYDTNVDWKHWTHQTNHHIDEERDFFMKGLQEEKCVTKIREVMSNPSSLGSGIFSDGKVMIITLATDPLRGLND